MPYTRIGFVDRELENHKQWDIEWFKSLFVVTITRKIDRATTNVHPLYREAKIKQLLTLVTNAFIKIDPPYQTLEKYGIEAPQQMLILWSNPLNTLWHVDPKIGDKVQTGYQQTYLEFEILTFKPADYWGNTGYPMHHVSTAKRTIE